MSEPKGESPQVALEDLVAQIAHEIEAARGQVRLAVNRAIVQSYWQIGRLIVEHEQRGESRAAYGKQQLQQLSQQLTDKLGKGFDVRNLRNMRAFCHTYPIRDALRTELSWTHTGWCCAAEKSEAVVKYSVLADQQQLFAAKYLPYLPSEEELKRELERERAQAMSQLAQQGAAHE